MISPPGTTPAAPGGGEIGFRRIGDVQGQMEAALRIAPVDDIAAFRRPTVALLSLVADGRKAQCRAIGAQDAATAAEDQQTLGLADLDQVGALFGRCESGN